MAWVSRREIARLGDEYGPALRTVVRGADADRALILESLTHLLHGPSVARVRIDGQEFERLALDHTNPVVQDLLGALVRTNRPGAQAAVEAAGAWNASLRAALPRKRLEIAWYERVPPPLRVAARQAVHSLSQPTVESSLDAIRSFGQADDGLRQDWAATYRLWVENRGVCLQGLARALPAAHAGGPVLIPGERVAQIHRAAAAARRRLHQHDHQLPAARLDASTAIQAARDRLTTHSERDLAGALGLNRADDPDLYERARAELRTEIGTLEVPQLLDDELEAAACRLTERAGALSGVANASSSEVETWRRLIQLQERGFDGLAIDTLFVPVGPHQAALPADRLWHNWFSWLDTTEEGRRLQAEGTSGQPWAPRPVEFLEWLAGPPSSSARMPVGSDPRPQAQFHLTLIRRADQTIAAAERAGREAGFAMLRADWPALHGEPAVTFLRASAGTTARQALTHASAVLRIRSLASFTPDRSEMTVKADSLCRRIDALHPLAASAVRRLPSVDRPLSPISELSTLLSSDRWTSLVEVSEKLATPASPASTISRQEAETASRLLEEWSQQQYLIQVVSTEDVHTAIELMTWVKALNQRVTDSAKLVLTRFTAVQNQRVEGDLRSYPLEKLRDTTKGKLNLAPMARAGIRTVFDVLHAGMTRLTSMPGVGYQTAAQVITAARTLATSLREDMGIRIDLDPNNEATTQLLMALNAHLILEPFERLSQVATEWTTTYSKALERPASDPRIFRQLKRTANPLEPWAGLRIFPGADELTSVSRRLPAPAPSKEALWEHFQHESPRYYQALSRITGIAIDVEAEQGHLPAEIAEAVRSFRLDRSLLNVSLREYQVFGAKYALVQHRALLGDEMGLGKTIQALAVLAHLAASGADHFLVICPVSVLYNWLREVRSRTHLSAHLLHGPDRGANYSRWRSRGGIAVTSYGYAEHLATESPHLGALIVDEAHYIKNPNAKRSRAARALAHRTERALFLTGTPLENRLNEFARVVEPLNQEIAEAIDAELDFITPKRFRESVAPVYLRRNTEDVLTELPDLVEVFEEVELSSQDRRHYLRALGSSHFQEMRRAAFASPESAKLKRLQELADEAASNDRKVVVFTYFLDVAQAVCRLFGRAAFGPITGQTPAAARQGVIDLFTNTNGPAVLVAQIVAGGTGLNIQAASVVVICEPQVKPTLETQAIGRVHRMGQLRSVRSIVSSQWTPLMNESLEFSRRRGVSSTSTRGEARWLKPRQRRSISRRRPSQTR